MTQKSCTTNSLERKNKSDLSSLVNKLHQDIFPNCTLVKNSNLRYVGFSVYRKKKPKDSGKDTFTIIESAALYANASQSLKTTYDDFNGYLFHSIQGSESGEEISGKDFKYLKLFFPDIDFSDDYYNKFYLFKLSKKKYLQIVFLYRHKPNTFNQAIQTSVKKFKKHFKHNKNISLPATRTIKNSSILIIDLIRNPQRKGYNALKYADASITRKLIFDIAKIVVNYGFYIAGHTGDGFFFLCEKKDIAQLACKQAEAILYEIETYFEEVTSFLKPLNHSILNHKLRILFDKIDTVFETNTNGWMSTKLYFSPDLDKKFEKMKYTTKHAEKHLLLSGSIYEQMEWTSPSFEIKKGF